jgi:hypothetical protein
MDTLAHGLWGGAAFYRERRRKFFAAVLLGMTPDLFSFGLFHVTNPGWIGRRLIGEISGPPDIAILPGYLFHAYNITHSLIVWGAIFAVLWLARRKPPWLVSAAMLHVVCDIPTHTERYFPTPFLWPFPTPFVNGIAWSTPWFIATNYTAIAAVYAVLFFSSRQRHESEARSGLDP